MSEVAKGHGEHGLLKAAILISAVIFLSKVAGFLRDVAIANYYGAGLVSDAYFYAYQIPALVLVILGGVGGPFHSATVAIFSKIITDFRAKPEEEVKKLFNVFETLTLIAFGVLGILCFFFPTQIMGFIITDKAGELLPMAASQLKIMSPILVIGALMGIYYGILVTYKRFLLPNISPSVLSIVIIIVLLVTKGDASGIILAIATSLGALCQLLVQVPAVLKLGYSFKPNFDFIKDKFVGKNLKDLSELLFPAFLSSTIGQIGLYVDMFFSSGLQEGAWTAFGYANRVFQFPVGMLLTAILVPLFPLFSRLVGQNDLKGLEKYFTKGVGSLFFVGSYLMITIFIIRTDAIRIALQRGAFDAQATLLVSEILFFITLSILPYVFRDSATRLLYAFGDSKTPFITATCSIILKVILNLLLVKPFGINGIALSTTLVTLFNAVVLGLLTRRKVQIGYRKLFFVTMKILLASAVAWAFGAGAHLLLSRIAHWSLLFGLVKISIVSLVALVAYVLIAHILKIEYLGEVVERFRAKFFGAKNEG